MAYLEINSYDFNLSYSSNSMLFVGCLKSQQHVSVSQGRICSDNFTCCHTEIEVADQTPHLTQSQYTDTGSTSPSTDPIRPGAWQSSHWNANFYVTGMTLPWKKSRRKRDSNPGSSPLEMDTLTTRPTRRSSNSEAPLSEIDAKMTAPLWLLHNQYTNFNQHCRSLVNIREICHNHCREQQPTPSLQLCKDWVWQHISSNAII